MVLTGSQFGHIFYNVPTWISQVKTNLAGWWHQKALKSILLVEYPCKLCNSYQWPWNGNQPFKAISQYIKYIHKTLLKITLHCNSILMHLDRDVIFPPQSFLLCCNSKNLNFKMNQNNRELQTPSQDIIIFISILYKLVNGTCYILILQAILLTRK